MSAATDAGTSIHEVAPDVFRISTFIPDFDLQFNQFLVRDDAPLLFHTGMRSLFPVVRDAVSRLIDPSTLRFISFSHFEADESGALNEWLALAPRAEAACSQVGAMVSVNDFALRPARALGQDEVIDTGRHRLRFRATPQVPHAWDAGLLFDETTGALFCSDLFLQLGQMEPSTESDILERVRAGFLASRGTPFDHATPYTPNTRPLLEGLAALDPRVLLAMHGSTYVGDGRKAILQLADLLEEVFGAPDQRA
jgi:flavorubredoxin